MIPCGENLGRGNPEKKAPDMNGMRISDAFIRGNGFSDRKGVSSYAVTP
jgi:hypothetical protein